MPIQVHNFVVRARDGMNADQRCLNKEQADDLYKQFADAVSNAKEFFEVKVGDDVLTLRTSTINSFGIRTYLEQTPEEIKAAQIAAIESGSYGVEMPYNTACKSGSIGQKLVGGW